MKELKILEAYRGIYTRVARACEVDPSYVSRVARGERRCQRIEAALLKEVGRIERKRV